MPYHKVYNHPWIDHCNDKLALEKEKASRLLWEENYKKDLLKDSLPKRGEEVLLAGIRRRPELNGVQAKVASFGPDEDGFVTLHVTQPNSERKRKMKVHNLRLQPLSESASSPALLSETLGTTLGVSLDDVDSTVSGSTLVSGAGAVNARGFRGRKSLPQSRRVLTEAELSQWTPK
eukprot:CAMPEP_0169333366 /NCGR_PEP_ID=MMETSP1017-20121227/15220_1 /TAXON_ID=342587 /ORGANISM="Karlodinium micrum, Strain CCMP2283" /LENGTH=175 /DNA_ID=CAMNT_0009428581 /DNA_START=88 /DNA_END=612 /DNA_ORIENTATION=-